MPLLFSFRGNYYDPSCREGDEEITALMAGNAIDLSVSGYAAKRSSVCGHPLRGQIENMDRIGAAFANIQLRVAGRKRHAVGLRQGIIRKDGSVAVIHLIIQPFEIQLSVCWFDAVIRIGEVYGPLFAYGNIVRAVQFKPVIRADNRCDLALFVQLFW